jgi:hypothetical protein
MTETLTLQIVYPDGSSEGLRVTPLGPKRYRLEETSFLEEVHYGDVIETEPQLDGSVLFRRVVEHSPLQTTSWMLTEQQMNAPNLQTLLDRIMQMGGNWERTFGGVLVVHLPLGVSMDLESEIKALSPTS